MSTFQIPCVFVNFFVSAEFNPCSIGSLFMHISSDKKQSWNFIFEHAEKGKAIFTLPFEYLIVNVKLLKGRPIPGAIQARASVACKNSRPEENMCFLNLFSVSNRLTLVDKW